MSFLFDSLAYLGDKLWELFRAIDPFKFFAINARFKQLFQVVGGVTALYWGLWLAKRFFEKSSVFCLSFFNARKYLDSKSPDPKRAVSAFAVIYGAANKVGRAYSQFLLEKGFSIILIDRDMRTLNDLEYSLQDYMVQSGSIFKIQLGKFDQDSIQYALKDVSDKPVKIIVNCKNSKRRQTKVRQTLDETVHDSNDAFEDDEELTDQAALNVFSKQEIYYTGKENMEGYTSVVHQFLPQIMEHPQSCLINVNNNQNVSSRGYRKPKAPEQGRLYYDATVLFKSQFTSQLARSLRSKGLIGLNVHTDFQSFTQEKSHKLCQRTFDYLGLEEELFL